MSGRSRAWRRVASMPSRRGISRSMSTTSGSAVRASSTASSPSAARPTTSMSWQRLDQPPETVADDAVVVGDEDADHGAGTSSSTVVPCAGRSGRRACRPPARTRSVEQRAGRRGPPRRGARARPARSRGRRRVTASRVSPPARASTSTRTVSASACSLRRCAAPPARPGRAARSLRRAGAAVVGDVAARSSMPSRAQRAQQVARAPPGARRLQARRVDLDEQRAQVAHALAQPRDRVAQRAAASRVAAALRRLGQRREPERDAGEVLHHAVVQVGRDPAALAARRPRSRWRAAPRARAARAAGGGPATRRAGPGTAAARAARRAAAARARAAAARPLALTDAEPLVDLEQQRRAVRRADRRVGLQQLALRALVAVLGLGQVAELGVGAAGLEQLLLLRAERVARADQLRLVGVEDPCRRSPRSSRGRPARRGPGLARRRRLGDRRRVAASTPSRQRGLDEPPVGCDELPRLALGLVRS